MPDQTDLGYAIKLPPRRAISYFKSKGYAISWNWWETWQAAHAKAFTVAKAMRLDVLQTIRTSVDKALEQGVTEQQFSRVLELNLKRRGWWGRQVIVDSEGKAESVQLGSPHRLKTIYRTNMNTARAAARYQAQVENADDRPYWMYDALEDGRTRPSHAAINNQVFRYDDPFWDSHYPPNGFNCRCRVRALTAGQVEERGLKINQGKGSLDSVRQHVGIDKRTGEVITRPGMAYRGKDARGGSFTFTPDAGWSYNPGKDFPLIDPNGGTPDEVLGLLKSQKSFRDFALPKLVDTPGELRRPAPDLLPRANGREAALKTLNEVLAIPEKGWREVETPKGLHNVIIAKSYLPHIVEKRNAARERYANYILPTLQDPLEVWLSEYEDGSFRRRFITLFEGDREQSLVIARENKDGSLLFNFVPASVAKGNYLDNQRRGFLLHRKVDQ